jgi:maleate isomerase
MNPRIRLGVLTPSSNTSLEPLTGAMVSSVPGVSAHFARFTVTEISLGQSALGQFDDTRILEAAKLLADAKVDSIGWSGTSSGWLGFDADERLVRRITEATGIPATTSVLALNEIMQKMRVRKLGLVTPYLANVQERIVENYARSGITVSAERHLDISVNFDFAQVKPETLRAMVKDVAAARPDAITTFCTNLSAAHLVPELEKETGIPVLDTVSTVVWKQLRMAGVDTRKLDGWGRLFREVQ